MKKEELTNEELYRLIKALYDRCERIETRLDNQIDELYILIDCRMRLRNNRDYEE